MSLATDTFSMIGVPTCLDDIEVRAEVAIPGVDYLVTVLDVTTQTRRTSTSTQWVTVVTYETHDGQRATHEGSRFDRLPVFTALDDLILSATHGAIDKAQVGDLVPALCIALAAERREAASLRDRLGESRRMVRELTPGGAR